MNDVLTDEQRKEQKRILMRDAGLLALKMQAEWNDQPHPDVAGIEKRIAQVILYPANDQQTQAMKDLVLASLGFKLELLKLRNETSLFSWIRRFLCK